MRSRTYGAYGVGSSWREAFAGGLVAYRIRDALAQLRREPPELPGELVIAGLGEKDNEDQRAEQPIVHVAEQPVGTHKVRAPAEAQPAHSGQHEEAGGHLDLGMLWHGGSGGREGSEAEGDEGFPKVGGGYVFAIELAVAPPRPRRHAVPVSVDAPELASEEQRQQQQNDQREHAHARQLPLHLLSTVRARCVERCRHRRRQWRGRRVRRVRWRERRRVRRQVGRVGREWWHERRRVRRDGGCGGCGVGVGGRGGCGVGVGVRAVRRCLAAETHHCPLEEARPLQLQHA